MDSSDSISVGGLDRTYVLRTPASSSAPRALLLVFHGGGGQGRGMARLTHFDEIADREGFVVAYPGGFGRLWAARRLFAQGVDDIGFVSTLINKLTVEHHIDPSKVYAAGISNGGFFSQRLAIELSGKIKALATVAATMPMAFAEAQSLARPVSVMLIHGTQDPLVPFEGGRVRAGLGDGFCHRQIQQ